MIAITHENITAIRNEIAAACQKAGRQVQEVRLVAVSKFVPVEKILTVYNMGQKAFGENRVQDLLKKRLLLPLDIEWHLIGTLQRNKVKDIVGLVSVIHSVDSILLAREISRCAVKKNVTVTVLLQVNIAKEAAKHGFLKDDLFNSIFEIAGLPGINVRGLMTIAPLVPDPESIRDVFSDLKLLAQQIDALRLESITMEELSMGMSDDFHVAIEEGATLVRIGSRIFGPRYNQEGV